MAEWDSNLRPPHSSHFARLNQANSTIHVLDNLDHCIYTRGFGNSFHDGNVLLMHSPSKNDVFTCTAGIQIELLLDDLTYCRLVY